jgi:arginase
MNTFVQMFDVDRLGIGRIMEETVQHLQGYENIHLSYDIDALDPHTAPHTGTSVRGGLTYREGNYICESLWATGRLKSMELVEVNMSLHSDMDPKITSGTAQRLL